MKLKKILFLLILLLVPIVKVDASSFNVSASSRNVTVGSSVTIYINGSDVIGKVNISSSNASVLSSSSNSAWLEPSSSVTFKANKIGSAKVTVSTNSLSNGSGDDISLGSKSISINVVAKKAAASSNNSLSALSVEGLELNPVFDSSTTEYNVSAKKGTESVNISATMQDTKASINGIGNIPVTEGLNVVNVVVTAENGYSKTYVLNINVEEDPIIVLMDKIKYSIVKQQKALPTASSYYSYKTIKYKYKMEGQEESITYDIPAYYSEITKYTLVGLKDEKGKINLYIYNKKNNSFTLYNEYTFSPIIFYPMEVPKEKVLQDLKKTSLKLGEDKINAYTYSKKSDYYLMYGINIETGEEGWYQYDNKNNTIQRYDTAEINKLINKNNKFMIVVVLLSSVCFLMMLFLLIFINKTTKEKKVN